MLELADSRWPRLTWDTRGPAPYESVWSILLKVASLNLLSAAELIRMLSVNSLPRAGSGSLRLAADQSELEILAQYLRISKKRLHTGNLTAWGLSNNLSTPYGPRHCPECFKLGYHCALFDLPFIAACPWHSKRLLGACAICARALIRKSQDGLNSDRRWECRTCGSYFDFRHEINVNKIDSHTEIKIRDFGDELTAWWTEFRRRSSDSSAFALQLLHGHQEEFSLQNRWRLGFIEALIPHPDKWQFVEQLELTHSIKAISIRLREKIKTKNKLPPEDTRQEFKSIRRAIFRRFIIRHRKCLMELQRLDGFERSALDSDCVCTVAVAWLSWLMAHECHQFKNGTVITQQTSSDSLELRLGAYEPDGKTAKLRLVYANFHRILGTIEATIPTRAVRVCHLDASERKCDLPFRIISGVCGDTVEMLIPDCTSLERRARMRCIRRIQEGLSMHRPYAAQANAGWDAALDTKVPFTIRSFGDGVRNTYWHLQI
ncbi:hypothetical protein BLA6993_04117 [Burkholderia lata]|uniref:hypothetical protein n=1 Tax=Burkholderia lata (strain ATCC 17760 / DSM 23089 / LMG 22485 / NCIMB 9086 / R18194 / 383) TaxID=482957 RepID=UPI0014536A2F|nr:hypothetical protein [Burkholderia lata]VWB86615.1 hypothetical protein BLA6993_04117 [Burkholderia lata]